MEYMIMTSNCYLVTFRPSAVKTALLQLTEGLIDTKDSFRFFQSICTKKKRQLPKYGKNRMEGGVISFKMSS